MADEGPKVVEFKDHAERVKPELEDIIEWLRAHQEDGSIDKLSVIFETEDRRIFSRSINLANKDYVYFLMQELMIHFNSGDEDD